MCGIAGFTWRDERLIRAMTGVLRHRGPDDEGFHVDGSVSLGHRRLAIIELSGLGHQPMAYTCNGRRAILTFNGEIFNFRAIRRELKAKGYRFDSESDSEVVLASYLEWGSACVQRFNGMWAFALYEPEARTLFLSRDRFGEKPLHYRLLDGGLIFGSEIKAILVHRGRRRADPEAVSNYLYRAEANTNLRSFFDDILMLPPAHNAVFDLGKRHFTADRYYAPRLGNRRVMPDEFRAVLRTCVERRLVADVPVSISLSGGTDSTAVAALTAQLTDARTKVFTTAADGGVGDEAALVSRFLAGYPQFDLERARLSEGRFCAKYRDILHHMDEPFVRQSAYVRWEISHLARRHHRRVLLSGEGADEVMGGYASFVPRFLLDLLRRFRWIRFGRELAGAVVHPERRRIAQEARTMLSEGESGRARQAAEAKEFQNKFGITLERVERTPRAPQDIKGLLAGWVHESSLPRLLMCDDKMAMANSVEARAPFLDHEFVDMVFSMCPDDLIVGGARKFPLREAMKGLVPDEIRLRRDKNAFNAPIFDYLRGHGMKRRIEGVFRDPCTATVFNPRAYLEEYSRFLSGSGGNQLFLLHGFLLEEWARMFGVDFG